MFTLLLILFIVIPVAEIFLLVKAGQIIGTVYTISIVLLTGTVGASLARWQGTRIISEIRTAIGNGQIPGKELLQGAMVLAGGIMLMTPGFITDFFGLTLLFPLTRNLYTRMAIVYIRKKFQTGQAGFATTWTNPNGAYTVYTTTAQPSDSFDSSDSFDYDGETIDYPKISDHH